MLQGKSHGLGSKMKDETIYSTSIKPGCVSMLFTAMMMMIGN